MPAGGGASAVHHAGAPVAAVGRSNVIQEIDSSGFARSSEARGRGCRRSATQSPAEKFAFAVESVWVPAIGSDVRRKQQCWRAA